MKRKGQDRNRTTGTEGAISWHFLLGLAGLLAFFTGLFALSGGHLTFEHAPSNTVAVRIDNRTFTAPQVYRVVHDFIPSEIIQQEHYNEAFLLNLHFEDFLLIELVREEYRSGTRGLPPSQLDANVLLKILPPNPDIRRAALNVIATNMTFLQQSRGHLPVTDKQVDAYYQAHAKEFIRDERVNLAQLIFDNEAMARQVYHQIRISPEVFDYYAQLGRQSTEGRRFLGLLQGATGFLPMKMLPDFLRKTVKTMKIGDVSKPIQIGAKFLLFKLIDRRAAGTAPLGEVAKQIRWKIFDEELQAFIPTWTRKLFHHHTITIHWNVLGIQSTGVVWRWTPRDVVRELAGKETP